MPAPLSDAHRCQLNELIDAFERAASPGAAARPATTPNKDPQQAHPSWLERQLLRFQDVFERAASG